MEEITEKAHPENDYNEQYRISDEIKIEFDNLKKLVPNAVLTLDGLWFMNVLESIGLKDALKMDLTVISNFFKLTTRYISDNFNVDGKTIIGKAHIFSYMAFLYGHQYELYSNGQSITFKIIKCGLYEYLKNIGRDKEWDCTYICKNITPSWIEEIDRRAEVKTSTFFNLPTGGSSCRWCVKQPL